MTVPLSTPLVASVTVAAIRTSSVPVTALAGSLPSGFSTVIPDIDGAAASSVTDGDWAV